MWKDESILREEKVFNKRDKCIHQQTLQPGRHYKIILQVYGRRPHAPHMNELIAEASVQFRACISIV